MYQFPTHCDSTINCLDGPIDFDKLTVKFQISDYESIAQVYPCCMTIFDVKEDLAAKFEVSAKYLVICQQGHEAKDTSCLSDLQKNEFGIVEVSLKVDNEQDLINTYKLTSETYYNKHKLPDFITVAVPDENNHSCPCNNIIVEIENAAIKKPFLGGHRDLRTE